MIAAVVLLIQSGVFAQSQVIRTYVEKTIVNTKSGFSIGYESIDGFEVGGFYQESSLLATFFKQEAGLSYPHERSFFGSYFACPVIYTDIGWVKLNVRAGVSNKENFVITPSILGEIRPEGRLSLGLGLGTRAFRPTYQAYLTIRP